MIAGGYDDAVTAFTSVAARKFASPSCQQLRALSSRFSESDCPDPEGTRLSGERVITRADSFHSASTSTSRRTHPLISRVRRDPNAHWPHEIVNRTWTHRAQHARTVEI